jgi:hypothetical protein
MPKGSRRRCSDEAYMKHLFTSDESIEWAEDSPVGDEEQGMGDMPAIRQAWHSRRHKEALSNHQMDMAPFQVQPSIKSDGPGNREMRRRQGDIIDEDRSKVNDESTRWSRGTSAVDKRQGTVNIPDPQLPTCSRTRETSYDSLQTAMPSVQGQPSIQVRNLGYGERRRHQGDAVYNRRLTKNDVTKGKLTKSSVRRQERSTDLYSQTRRPKAPDKRVRQVDDRPPRVTEDLRGDHNGTRTMKRSYTNIEPATNRSGGALVTQGSTRSKTRNGYLYDPQTAVPLSQPQLSRGLSNPVNGELRGRPGDARYGEQMRINSENSRIPKEVVNGRWTACCTPSLTKETGYLPVPQ